MSVAHELGHLILHRYVTSGTEELETNAYSFASELLMPSNAILDDLTAEKLNLFLLAKLKGTWGVSMKALARRSRELEVINDRQCRYLMKQLSINKRLANNRTQLGTNSDRKAAG
jgi:Zn-dependent peptidase ImmA (M78 family)